MKLRKFRNSKKVMVGMAATAIALTAIALVAGSGSGHGHHNPPPPPPPPPHVYIPPIVIQPVVIPSNSYSDSFNSQISNITNSVDSSNNLLVDTSGSLYSALPNNTCGCWWTNSGPQALQNIDIQAMMSSNVNISNWVDQHQSN